MYKKRLKKNRKKLRKSRNEVPSVSNKKREFYTEGKALP